MRTNSSTTALTAVVWFHFIVTLLHGAAHLAAPVVLGPAALAFVIVVIEIGPLAGLAWSRGRPVAGALGVTVSMAAALLFGLVNHFLVPGNDHVSHVAADWRWWFGSTALLLVLIEVAGVTVGLRCALHRRAAALEPSLSRP